MNERPQKIGNKLLVGTLEQFKENGNIFTYMPDCFIGPNSYAVFKVYRKKPLSLIERMQIFFGDKYKWRKSVCYISSQVNVMNSK